MTSSRSARQLGTRRLAAATAGLVTVVGAGVAVLVAHDAAQAHASTTNSGTSSTGSTSGTSNGPSLAQPNRDDQFGSGSQSQSQSAPDATSGGS